MLTPLIWAVLRPTHGSLPIDPLMDIPKGFSSKMILEVAARGLKVFTSYKLKTHLFGKLNAFCTKIMSFVINLSTVCMALCGILMPKGLEEKIGFWQLLDLTLCFELLTQDT